jgi:uncharacterized protein YdaU (DUF1376 family)
MKDPAFLFYTSDFLTGTMFMTNEQIGIYMRLLCSQHQHGGIIDKVTFNSMVSTHDIIRSKFIECEDGFYNERLMQEMAKRSVKSTNLSKAAKETWLKRKNTIVKQTDTIALQSQSNSNTIPKKKRTKVIRPENENEVINYFIDNGYRKEIAIKAFRYYNEADWHDSKGDKILNWKQKIQSVWFKPENEIQKAKTLEQEKAEKIKAFQSQF